MHEITGADSFTKVLGMEWNATLDVFRPVISSCKSFGTLTKRSLMSEIARIFNVMGWCLPTIIKPKIMLQDLWKEKTDWDQPVSQTIRNVWQEMARRAHSSPRPLNTSQLLAKKTLTLCWLSYTSFLMLWNWHTLEWYI